jgi:hypothetical protein
MTYDERLEAAYQELADAQLERHAAGDTQALARAKRRLEAADALLSRLHAEERGRCVVPPGLCGQSA